ncbi:MAG: ABC transporter permease [Lachnospiraceae bacterium]
MNEPISKNQRLYLQKIKRTRTQVRIWRSMILIVFLVQWELTARLGWIDSFLFSSPGRVIHCFLDLWKESLIMQATGITLLETVISFLLVTMLTLVVTILLWFSSKASQVLEPYMVVLNSLPKSALAPLFIVWFGANPKTIIVTGSSIAIFGSILSLYTAFQEVDSESVKLIYTLGGKQSDVLWHILLPSNIPVLSNLMKVNIGLCLVGVVIGEFMAGRNGLGYLIIYGSQVFKMDWVILSILILCIIAVGLYQTIALFEKKILKNFL